MKQIAVNTLDNGLARTVTTSIKGGGEINAMGGTKHFPMLSILVINIKKRDLGEWGESIKNE